MQLRLAARGSSVGVCGRTYHSLESKRLELLDRLRGPLLEANTVELAKQSAIRPCVPSQIRITYALVHVDGVLAGHDVGDGRAGGLSCGLLGRHSGSGWSAGVAEAISRDGRGVLDRFEVFVWGRNYVLGRRLDLVHSESVEWCRGVVGLAGFDKPTSGEFCTRVFREFCESAGLGLQSSRNCPKVEWRRGLAGPRCRLWLRRCGAS